MSHRFGPQLIGQTEKTLNALLESILAGRLTEPEWVALRLADMLHQEVTSSAALIGEVVERAHFESADVLVESLTTAGLLSNGRLTEEGRTVVSQIQAEIGERTGSVWEDLPPEDVAAATRVLIEVMSRARAALT